MQSENPDKVAEAEQPPAKPEVQKGEGQSESLREKDESLEREDEEPVKL
jgi:hypothetical protein